MNPSTLNLVHEILILHHNNPISSQKVNGYFGKSDLFLLSYDNINDENVVLVPFYYFEQNS